jgi:hypothetical protein
LTVASTIIVHLFHKVKWVKQIRCDSDAGASLTRKSPLATLVKGNAMPLAVVVLWGRCQRGCEVAERMNANPEPQSHSLSGNTDRNDNIDRGGGQWTLTQNLPSK